MNKEIPSTFIKLNGTTDEMIEKSTGLKGGIPELLQTMRTKSKKKIVDLLLPTPCNQDCNHCFFKEEGGPAFIRTTPELIAEVRTLIDVLRLDQTNLTIYPREITCATDLLPVYAERGVDRALTNIVLLNNSGVIEQLKKFGIKNLAVSLHGNQESHTTLTGVSAGDYQKTIEGIKKTIDSDFEISIFTTVYRGNVADLKEFFSLLARLGLKEVKLIRLIPAGSAKKLNDAAFLQEEDVRSMLWQIDSARKQFPDLRIALLGASFGPNFYSPATYRYLAGQSNTWPNSTYICPWTDQDYIGISLGTKNIYPCFEALSFPETRIGSIVNGQIEITKSDITTETLTKNLRGDCSDSCQFQPLCLGGCRVAAFSFAKRRNEQDPLFAGQDVCLTKILSQFNE